MCLRASRALVQSTRIEYSLQIADALLTAFVDSVLSVLFLLGHPIVIVLWYARQNIVDRTLGGQKIKKPFVARTTFTRRQGQNGGVNVCCGTNGK